MEFRIVPTLRDPALYEKLFFPMLVLYRHPADFPSKYVVRVWDMDKPQANVLICDALEDAIRAIPPRFIRMERMEQDDPNILATFI